MRRVLGRDEFTRWIDGFLPAVTSSTFDTLTRPPEIRDLEDPRIGHLIGLSLQRATSLRGIASALPAGDERRQVYERVAEIHAADGLEKMWRSGYGGEHWLASFALALLTGSGPY